MDEKDLKIMALKEQFSDAVSQYQDRIADLRVANTILTQQLKEAQQTNSQNKAGPDLAQPSTEVVEGVVLDDG